MKYSLILLSLLILCGLSNAQDAHINFESGDWEAALKKAQEEDKVIFVDAFTTWCGPCKMMAKKVFTDNEVSAFYNDNFVNMKIDMEKGEGILFAKAYGVKAYPTFVFVDGKGNIAHKGLGYMEAEKFIKFGQEATDEDNRLGTLEMKYKKGERDPTFLKQYSLALSKAYDDHASEIASEYLASQTDWGSEENASYLVDMSNEDPKSELYQYMKNNRQALLKYVDLEKIDRKLKIGLMRKIHADNMDLEEQETSFIKTFGVKGAEYFAEYNMRKYSRIQDEAMKADYLKAASHYINTFNVTDWRLLNQVAWAFYENTDDKAYLKQARDWAMTSVKQDSNFMNNDTVAALCFKLGDKKRALKHAKEAIALAKKEGQDASDTEELLQKINAL